MKCCESAHAGEHGPGCKNATPAPLPDLDESACHNSGCSRLEAAIEDRWHALPLFVRDRWGGAITEMIALAREDEREGA